MLMFIFLWREEDQNGNRRHGTEIDAVFHPSIESRVERLKNEEIVKELLHRNWFRKRRACMSVWPSQTILEDVCNWIPHNYGQPQKNFLTPEHFVPHVLVWTFNSFLFCVHVTSWSYNNSHSETFPTAVLPLTGRGCDMFTPRHFFFYFHCSILLFIVEVELKHIQCEWQ